MSDRSSAELKLSLNDLIANTIYEFLDNDDVSPEDERENRLAIEDTAESILNILGIEVNDGPNADGEIEATITRNMPDEFRI